MAVDTDGDGKLSQAEAAGLEGLAQVFSEVDADGDGFITRTVAELAQKRQMVIDGVAKLKRAALKKLFHTPHFNTMDGLDVYIEDFNLYEPLPASSLLPNLRPSLLVMSGVPIACTVAPSALRTRSTPLVRLPH